MLCDFVGETISALNKAIKIEMDVSSSALNRVDEQNAEMVCDSSSIYHSAIATERTIPQKALREEHMQLQQWADHVYSQISASASSAGVVSFETHRR